MKKVKAYKGTSVNWAKSQTVIVKMLNLRSIYETRFTNLENKFVLEFMVINKSLNSAGLNSLNKPVAIRIIVPYIKISDEKKREKELNRLHRVLYHHLKSKFTAIDEGLTEFMEEFMPHLVVIDKNGNSTTMGQALLPQYKENIESGTQKTFTLLGDGK